MSTDRSIRSRTRHPMPSSAVPGLRGLVADWSSDRETFHVAWGKAMMWVFLLSDTFIFGSFLTGYMTVRASTTVAWPNASQVFSLNIAGTDMPLILIAIMTFVLITSSGTMAMAVNYAYQRERSKAALMMFVTAAFGVMFVGMQAFEWTKLIHEGRAPVGQPDGRGAVRLDLLHDHRLPRTARERAAWST